MSTDRPSPPAPSTPDLVEMHRRMLLIRGFEQRVSALYRDGEVPGFVHLSIGQEASAVGACWPLDAADVITSTHRGHGHCLAKGLDPQGMFAELMARDGGTNRGRGGSMHIADPNIGILGANGIVAAGVPIAVKDIACTQGIPTTAGSSQASTSCTTWVRLSPSQRVCSNLPGRSIPPP